jgi:hypothetical protein
MYAIYGNIYHQYTPNVSIYIQYMYPKGLGWVDQQPGRSYSLQQGYYTRLSKAISKEAIHWSFSPGSKKGQR